MRVRRTYERNRKLRLNKEADTLKKHFDKIDHFLNTSEPRRGQGKRGKSIYSHRMSVVEPVFSDIGTNKRLNRFSLRGKRKIQGQWQLYCMVHSIEKIMNYGVIGQIQRVIHN